MFEWESCPMLRFLHTHKKKLPGNGGVFSVFWVLSLSFGVLQMCVCVCVERGHMLCAYTKLTFRLHHTWHRCLHCTLVWLFIRKIHLHQTPSWLWLLCTSSPVFTVLDRWTKPCNSLTPSCMCVQGNYYSVIVS